MREGAERERERFVFTFDVGRWDVSVSAEQKTETTLGYTTFTESRRRTSALCEKCFWNECAEGNGAVMEQL